MVKFSKSFFKGNEVIFVGYSSRNKGYSSAILNGFHEHKIKVYPYNVKEQGNYDTKVYHKLEDIPDTAKEAYILVNKNNTPEAVKQLISKGVKRILFYSKNAVEEGVLAECEKAGIETAAGCPLMIYGSGFHKFHAFLAGVK